MSQRANLVENDSQEHRPGCVEVPDGVLLYLAAARPAAAISPSWLAAAPAAAIAPAILPSIRIGRPPSIGVTPGKPDMRGVELPGATESCSTFVGRFTALAVTALAIAMSMLAS